MTRKSRIFPCKKIGKMARGQKQHLRELCSEGKQHKQEEGRKTMAGLWLIDVQMEDCRQREAGKDAESEEKMERHSASEKRGVRKGRNRRKQSQPERAREGETLGDTEKDGQQGPG